MANDITELQSIDFALSAVIANAFTSLASNGPENYKSFLTRPIKEKIFRADHGDAGELVRKIANAEKGEGAAAGSTGAKPPVLPVVAYFRKPGLSNGDFQASILNKNMFNEALLGSFKVSILPISLDYSMTFATWDKPTLDKMQLAWYHYIAQHGRKNSRFHHPVKIGSGLDAETVMVPASFLDPKSVMFSDSSPEKDSVGRIYSVSTDFSITTQVLVGELVTIPDEITIVGITTSYISGESEA